MRITNNETQIRGGHQTDRAFVLGLAARLVDGFDVPTFRREAELIEGDRPDAPIS